MATTDVGALYTEHWPTIFAFLRRRLVSASDAEVEDVTADVFEKVVRFSGRYEDRGVPVQAWLFQITANALIDHVRAKAVRPVGTEIGEDTLEVRDPAASVGSDEHIAEFDTSQVAWALNMLSPLQRLVLIDQYWAGGTCDEAARLIGGTRCSVIKLRARGLATMRRLLEVFPTAVVAPPNVQVRNPAPRRPIGRVPLGGLSS